MNNNISFELKVLKKDRKIRVLRNEILIIISNYFFYILIN